MMSAVRGNQSTAEKAPIPAKSRFRRRTKVIFILVLCVFAYLGYRSAMVYQLRKLAWDSSQARQAGDWRSVEAISSRWGRWDPNTAIPFLLAAEAALEQRAMARAAEYLEQLPSGDPRTPTALLELATIYFGDLNQPQEGVAAYKRALKLDPDHAEAHRRLLFYYGITVQRTKMARQAREAIRRGCDVPETYVYLMGADWLTFSNAYDLNAKWLRSGTDNETYLVAQMVHWIGSAGLESSADFVEDVESNTLQQAEHNRLLEDCFRRYPNNPELLAYFLRQNATKGDVEAVAELLSQVPATAGDDNRFWHYKGWLHAARGELAEAEAAYRQALELNPYDWRSQLDLAGILRQQQRFEEVETLVTLSMKGRQLRRTVLELPDVQSVPIEVLQQMQQYAEGCGDQEVADRLAMRIEQMQAGRQPGY